MGIRLLTIESFDVHIRVFGETAILTRHTKLHAIDSDGKPHDNTHCSVDVDALAPQSPVIRFSSPLALRWRRISAALVRR